MKLVIPSLDQKLQSQLVDALRLITWQAVKAQYKLPQGENSFEFYSALYQEFEPEWKKHEIHAMELPKLIEFAKGLGYSKGFLMNFRSEHYSKRNGNKQDKEQNHQHNFDGEQPW